MFLCNNMSSHLFSNEKTKIKIILFIVQLFLNFFSRNTKEQFLLSSFNYKNADLIKITTLQRAFFPKGKKVGHYQNLF